MKRKTKAGITSYMLPVRAFKASDGAPFTGLVYNTASLVAMYRREGQSSWTSITLVTATAGTFTSGGFCAASGGPTNAYELHVPNAAVASGAKFVEIELYGATDLDPISIEIELDAVDYQDAAGFGLSRVDQNIGSRSSHSAANAATAVRSELATELARIDAAITSRSSHSAANAATAVRSELATELARIDAAITSRAAPGAQMTLTAGQVTTIVAAIEAEIADDNTGAAIKQAIVDKLLENLPDIDDLTLSAIATAARDAVLNRVLAGNHDGAGTLGKILQSITEARLAELDAANLPAAADTAASDATAAKTAAQSAKGVTDKLDTMLEPDGSDYRLTAEALAEAPAGGGGGSGPVTFECVPSVVSGGNVESGDITAYTSAKDTRSIILVDDNGDPIDLSAEDLLFVVEQVEGAADVFVKTTADDGGIEITGEDDNVATISYEAADVEEAGEFIYSLRRAGTDEGKVFAEGAWIVKRAALKDEDA